MPTVSYLSVLINVILIDISTVIIFNEVDAVKKLYSLLDVAGGTRVSGFYFKSFVGFISDRKEKSFFIH